MKARVIAETLSFCVFVENQYVDHMIKTTYNEGCQQIGLQTFMNNGNDPPVRTIVWESP